MVKFRRGLDWRISAALAGMASGRLSDTDLEAWFNLAVKGGVKPTGSKSRRACDGGPTSASHNDFLY